MGSVPDGDQLRAVVTGKARCTRTCVPRLNSAAGIAGRAILARPVDDAWVLLLAMQPTPALDTLAQVWLVAGQTRSLMSALLLGARFAFCQTERAILAGVFSDSVLSLWRDATAAARLAAAPTGQIATTVTRAP
jgi:hypothetical protein